MWVVALLLSAVSCDSVPKAGFRLYFTRFLVSGKGDRTTISESHCAAVSMKCMNMMGASSEVFGGGTKD